MIESNDEYAIRKIRELNDLQENYAALKAAYDLECHLRAYAVSFIAMRVPSFDIEAGLSRVRREFEEARIVRDTPP